MKYDLEFLHLRFWCKGCVLLCVKEAFSFSLSFVLTLARELVVQFIHVPSATQTNNESKNLDCLYFTVGDYLSLCLWISFAICPSGPFQRKIQGALKVHSTCMKDSLPRYSLRSDIIGLLTCSSSCSPPGKNLISLKLFGFGSWKQSLHVLSVAKEVA